MVRKKRIPRESRIDKSATFNGGNNDETFGNLARKIEEDGGRSLAAYLFNPTGANAEEESWLVDAWDVDRISQGTVRSLQTLKAMLSVADTFEHTVTDLKNTLSLASTSLDRDQHCSDPPMSAIAASELDETLL